MIPRIWHYVVNIMFGWLIIFSFHLAFMDIMLTQCRGSVATVGMFPSCSFYLCHLALGKLPFPLPAAPLTSMPPFPRYQGIVSGRRRLSAGGAQRQGRCHDEQQ